MSLARKKSKAMESELLTAAAAAAGHFRYESGHHGDLWLDLDALFDDARCARKWARALIKAARSVGHDIICGPETGGAFLAQLMAEESGAAFAVTERRVTGTGSVGYAVPLGDRDSLAQKRILLVDDAINAGFAIRSSLSDIAECRGRVVAIAALMTLGDAAADIAKSQGVRLFSLAAPRRRMWPPAQCPLCDKGVTLTRRTPPV